MNQVSVFGKVFSKVEFFDYVYDTFVEADWCEPGHPIVMQYALLRKILRSYGWEAEYIQWVADGAGANEAYEELHDLLSVNATA